MLLLLQMYIINYNTTIKQDKKFVKADINTGKRSNLEGKINKRADDAVRPLIVLFLLFILTDIEALFYDTLYEIHNVFICFIVEDFSGFLIVFLRIRNINFSSLAVHEIFYCRFQIVH